METPKNAAEGDRRVECEVLEFSPALSNHRQAVPVCRDSGQEKSTGAL
ncbi:MAG: hypothetical protein JWO59_1062 [Chloroflexi bacterium]|nr:hypothetical protein [Chloroflexota bacterium]